MGSGYRRREAVGACTESLGSESGDVGGGGAEIDVVGQVPATAEGDREVVVVEPRPSPEKRRRRLPPAMPRATEAFFMRAERHGGRLILTEVVRAERREVFRASRAGGRLRLRFADDEPDGDGNTGTESDGTEARGIAGIGVVVGGCCNGGEFCQVAAGAGRRVEIGAVMGI